MPPTRRKDVSALRGAPFLLSTGVQMNSVGIKSKTFVARLVIMLSAALGCRKDGNGSCSQIPILTEKKAAVSTISGDVTDRFDYGPAIVRHFQSPVDIAVAADGTVYVSDYNNILDCDISAHISSAGNVVDLTIRNKCFGLSNVKSIWFRRGGFYIKLPNRHSS